MQVLARDLRRSGRHHVPDVCGGGARSGAVTAGDAGGARGGGRRRGRRVCTIVAAGNGARDVGASRRLCLGGTPGEGAHFCSAHGGPGSTRSRRHGGGGGVGRRLGAPRAEAEFQGGAPVSVAVRCAAAVQGLQTILRLPWTRLWGPPSVLCLAVRGPCGGEPRQVTADRPASRCSGARPSRARAACRKLT